MAETPLQRAARRMGRTGKAFARAQFVAARSGEFDRAALTDALNAFLSAIPELAPLLVTGFPGTNALRWVPIGPSVSRNRTPAGYRRSTGRIKDIAVSPDGRRAYAASATGGVWYTEDAGATWAPIGGWANRARRVGGPNNAQSCSSILVHFGTPPPADPPGSQDFVMVGTGMGDMVWNRTPNRPALGGVGVLASLNPAATAGTGGDPWEAESGLNVMEGKGVFRMARDPGAVPGRASGGGLDRVLAASNQGLFLGTRRPAGAGGEFTWVELATLDGHVGVAAPRKPIVTDVLWINLPGQSIRSGQSILDGRIVVAVCKELDSITGSSTPVNAGPGAGVAFSDDLGTTWHWVTHLQVPAVAPDPERVGRISLALAPGTNRAYALGDIDVTRAGIRPSPQLWRIPDLTAASPTAATVSGVPAELWTNPGNQRDWDQCIAVDIAGGDDRVYFGGSASWTGGSLWCFDVDTAAMALFPAPGVARIAAPPGGEGAFLPGLIGDGVHADIQAIRLAGLAATRQVWVACDGGVFVSARAGRANTFQPRVNGLGAVEVNFIATHPTSSHFAAIGTQDNGRHMRAGDTVWEETVGGDGGGVAFHSNRSQFVLSQATRDDWTCTPSATFTHPLSRGSGAAPPREGALAAFYTAAATVRQSASVGRISLGTNRVWLTDNLGGPATNTWRALPYPSGALADPRPGGTDPNPNFGVPRGAPLPAAAGPGLSAMGVILTQKWVSPTQLLVLYEKGLVRWTQSGATWNSQILVAPPGSGALAPAIAGAPDTAITNLSDVSPVPESQDLYLTTTGDPASALDTCFFFENTANTFHRTALRDQLPAPSGLPRGPLDPAYAAVVDPGQPSHVYVGTVTGVWRGTRTSPAAHTWTPLPNGLPQANVQDLNIWTDGTTRLLRAAIQARGVWELDIGNGTEPQRTYVRVHARDDRRRLPTPMANPRRPPGINEPDFASPDIVIRPRPNPATAPGWQLGAGTIHAGNVPPYQLWTFQTAFRWHHPSVVANGEWSESLDALVQLHRTRPGLGPVEPKINQAMWDAVVGGTRLDAAGAIVAVGGDLAVYRPPWTSPGALTAFATELDLIETVVPPSTVANVQQLFNEPSTVDVLIHHRDTRPLNRDEAFVLLLWRETAGQAAALAPTTSAAVIQAYVTDVLDAEAITRSGAPTALPVIPGDWRLATTPGGRALHKLGIKLDARMPRAVSIDVDLSGVPSGHRVLFLAIVGSTVDPCGAALTLPTPPPPTPGLAHLVKGWPYAAMRLIRVSTRP